MNSWSFPLWLRVKELQWYVSVKCKCESQRCETTERRYRTKNEGPADELAVNRKMQLCKQCCSLLSDIRSVCLKHLWRLPCCIGVRLHVSDRTLSLLFSKQCWQRRCWTQPGTETMKCVHVGVYVFMCVLCLSYKHRRTRTAVTVSNENVYAAFDFCLSCSVAPTPTPHPILSPPPPLSLLLSLSNVVYCLACSCALWQQKRAAASINVYCVRVW